MKTKNKKLELLKSTLSSLNTLNNVKGGSAIFCERTQHCISPKALGIIGYNREK